MLQNDNILSKEKINILEQNYIESNSAPFVTKILFMYQNYMLTSSYRETQLRQDFQDLYHEAEKVNPAALPYADLTTLVFEDEQDSSEGFIIELKDFYTSLFYEKKEQDALTINDEKAISVLAKAAEHLNLALSQKNSLYKKQKDQLIILENGLVSEQETLKALKIDNSEYEKKIESLTGSIDTLESKLSKAQSLADANQNKYDKLTIDFLSMMGIFSTIIFAVFGGLSQIGAIGDNLAETPISKILMYVSLSSITLILIVFISFNAISKLTGLKLRSCTCKTEEECTCTLRQKHPSLSFSLFFFVDLFLFSLVLKAIRYSDWVSPFRDIFVFKTDNFLKLIIFSIFIIFNGLVLLKLLFPQSKRFFIRWIK
ncbi:hypothetical protein ACOYXX_13580, partial [Enterococcus thailandicus]